MAVSFKRGLFKNILISGSYNYICQGINFLSTIIISRLLSPDSYGLVGLITVFTNFILVFSDGGLSYALIRSDYGRTFQRVLTNIAWILGLLLFFITILMAYPIAVFYNNNKIILPTIVLAFTFILRSISLAQGAVLAKNLDFGYIGKITLLSTIGQIITTILLAYAGAGYWALIAAQIVLALVPAIAYEMKVKLGFKIYRLNYIKAVFRHTKKLVSSIIGFNSVNYWSRNADNMVVGKWFGVNDLGIYNRSYSLLTLPLVLITGLFNTILFPSLKKLESEGGNIQHEYYFVLKIISFLSFPLMALFILIPHQLVLFLWGISWIKVAELLPYFGLLIFTQTLLSTLGHLLILKGKEKQLMFGGWISAIFMVTAIIFGATISLVAIAQIYSLAYISLVLTFNIIYCYVYTLKFSTKTVIIYWLPKILVSLLIWVSLFWDMKMMQKILMGLLFVYLILDGNKELKKLGNIIVIKFLPYFTKKSLS